MTGAFIGAVVATLLVVIAGVAFLAVLVWGLDENERRYYDALRHELEQRQ